MSQSSGSAAFEWSYEITPIILQNGIATAVGGYLPIVSLTQSSSFLDGIFSGADSNLVLEQFFAHFVPLPGSTLIDNQFGKYPFANQTVAANSVIVQPLVVSLMMICPANLTTNYWAKLAVMTNLQTALAQHNVTGGTYIVATPSFIYPNCLLRQIRDVSTGETKQKQWQYQWDFEQPLLTLNQAQAAQNSLMSQLSAQTPINGTPSWSGVSSSPGNDPGLASVGTQPAATGAAGAGAGGGTFVAASGPQP